jgi:cytochrome P450
VPATGLTLPLSSSTSEIDDTITLPPGTIIGMNPWLIHRNTSIFGERPDDFIPERWLQDPDEPAAVYEARVKKMRDADMSFGNGNRACLGKPLALVELYKVAATLFGKYKVCRDPVLLLDVTMLMVTVMCRLSLSREWKLNKQWFVWPHEIKVKMSEY